MSSPVNIPFSEFIKIDRRKAEPVYLQIVYQFIQAIQRRLLDDGVRIPGSRPLSHELGIHRKTMVAALDELEAQGWVEIRPNIGTFVRNIEAKKRNGEQKPVGRSRFTGTSDFSFRENFVLDLPHQEHHCKYYFTDGRPDYRIIKTDELAQFYSAALRRRSVISRLSEYSMEGNLFFREQLSYYLNLTRGFHISQKNLLNTKNKAILLHILAQLLIREGERIAVGDFSDFLPNMIFNQAGAVLTTIPVDQNGIDVNFLRRNYGKGDIKFVMTSPQHQYPKTTNLSAERRKQLIALAEEYDFIIIEDDENHELTYERSAALPLVKIDSSERVIYLGSFGSFLIPGFQTTFLVAPEDFVREARKYLNVFGQIDVIKEQALADMIRTGNIHRYRRKALKAYHTRRDAFAELLLRHLADYITFDPPAGGLAFWVNFRQPMNLVQLSEILKEKGLFLPRTCLFQNRNTCALRLGFGHLNEKEMKETVTLLRSGCEMLFRSSTEG